MYTISAKEARNEFSALLDSVRSDPVQIQKNGKPVAVVISVEDYERLSALEDAWWAEKAKRAEKKGYLGVKATNALIRKILES
jgi:antitoxin Phd